MAIFFIFIFNKPINNNYNLGNKNSHTVKFYYSTDKIYKTQNAYDKMVTIISESGYFLFGIGDLPDLIIYIHEELANISVKRTGNFLSYLKN